VVVGVTLTIINIPKVITPGTVVKVVVVVVHLLTRDTAHVVLVLVIRTV
jgi:hypothetical protein